MCSPCIRAMLPALLFLSAACLANDNPIETMLVTASRTPVPESMIGSSVTVIDESQVESEGNLVLSDLLRDVPGFAVSRGGPVGALTQIRVRGAEANQVQVLIDGVKADDLSQEGEFNFAHLLIGDIDRIEIVRGPQSALWGSDALAGVINIITRRGKGPLSVSGFAQGGSFGTIYGGGSVSAGTDAYDIHVSAQSLTSAGSNMSRHGNEHDGYGNTTVSLSGGYRPTETFSLSATARHVAANNQFDDTDYNTGLPADTNTWTQVEQTYARLQGNLDLFENHWQHQIALGFSGDDNTNFDLGSRTGRTAGRRYEFEYQTSLKFGLSRLQDTHNVLTFAVDHQQENFMQRGTVTPFGDPNQDRGIHTTGIVGEYRFTASRSFSLSASVRHDYNSAFRDDTTWRLTGSYLLPGTGTRLRGSYGTGIKNPSFTERFGYYASSSTPFIGNPELKPEYSAGWEAGMDQELAGDRGRLGITWFEQNLKDEINGFAYDDTAGAFTAVNMPGISHRRGLEINARVTLIRNLELSAAYTWLDATEPTGFSGQIREIRRPRHSASVNLDYKFADDRGDLNVNVNYTGTQQDIFYPPFPQSARRVMLKPFTLVQLAASWQWNARLDLFCRFQNLLDQQYEEIYGYRSPGIGAFAGVRFRFNP